MLADIVLDTNVLMHADNLQEPRRADAQMLLQLLKDCDTKVCVDEGFNPIEAQNRSHIGSEYLRHLRVGTLGYALIVHMAQSQRIKVVARAVPPQVARNIQRQVTNTHDRTYLKVAFNSLDKTFASHDFRDLPQSVRDRLRTAIDVKVLAADEAVNVLSFGVDPTFRP